MARIKVAEALMKIHKRKVQHNDLTTSNVIVKGTGDHAEVRIIDFDEAEEHGCYMRMNVRLFAYMPTTGAFRCDEVHDFCREASLWTPR